MIVRLIRFAVWLISLLPLRVARVLGSLVGYCAWLSRSRGSRTAAINLKMCFPEKNEGDIRNLAKESMKQWGMTLFEIPVVWRKGPASLSWINEIQGMALMDEGRRNPAGVLLVSPHCGNWEVMGYWGGSLGPITTMYQPPRLAQLDDLLVAARQKTGANLVPTNAKGVAQLIKALKRGEIVGILPDMEPAINSGVFAPFFGIPALTMTLIHSLQQRTGATVVIGVAQRIKDGFKLVLIKPDDAISSDNVETSVAALNCAVETLVRLAPEQYQWEYKRFKRRPPGYAKLYD